MKKSERKYWIGKARTEREWYEQHGGCLEAYVRRYGDTNDPECYGAGGEAIHAADLSSLQQAEAKAQGATQ